ncbi:MAG: U32 family peptidase [Ignavibacteriales bacterium]|nr:U32 family peptidase [Ignavibacteriales bacterium]
MKKPELMAPAGDWTMLTTAVNSGADAVYFGTDKLNMRAKAKNFTSSDLVDIAKYCKENNVKTYLTLNSIVFEEELVELDEIIQLAKSAGIDMVICWDLSVIQKCIEYKMPFAISTQASISNSAAANFYKNLGAKRIVLARESSLKEIKKIRASTDLEIEAFVHGAMCIAVSGRCFMSHHLFGKSANRGECIQPCRREYVVYDKEIDKSMIIGEDYILSPKDLCTIEFLDKLIEAGIDSFKIEGRKRSPEYVAKVVSVYRKAIDLYFCQRHGSPENKLTEEIKKEFLEELKKVYNRGFSSGFYFNIPSSEEYTLTDGSIATTRKEYVGKVINYFKQPKAAFIQIESGKLEIGNDIIIIGKTSGVIEIKLDRILDEEIEITEAEKGRRVTFICEQQVRPHDMVYKVVKVHQEST